MPGLAWDVARAAIHARLWTDATLLALTGKHPADATKARVFDEAPPKGALYPHVILGEAFSSPNNRMGGKRGHSIQFFVHSWSKKETNDERDEVADRVDELLDNYLALVVTGWSVELLNEEETRHIEEFAGPNLIPMRHAIGRYRLDVVEA